LPPKHSETVYEIIPLDDQSSDETVAISRRLNLTLQVLERNRGYRGKKRLCWARAKEGPARKSLRLSQHCVFQSFPSISVLDIGTNLGTKSPAA
jgi:hypothetical protein